MRLSWSIALGVACLFLAPGLSQAAEPERKASKTSDPAAVAAAIDRELDKHLAQEKILASPASSDAEFLRRAYLDITGRIPTAEQAVAFLDSKDPFDPLREDSSIFEKLPIRSVTLDRVAR